LTSLQFGRIKLLYTIGNDMFIWYYLVACNFLFIMALIDSATILFFRNYVDYKAKQISILNTKKGCEMCRYEMDR